MSETAKFVFKGTDSGGAEDFVHYIRQRAFAEGKSRDNTWLVDLASSCFPQSALRWHATLDLEIRNDWNRLEAAILSRFRPVFKGIDGSECEEFLADVRQRILDQGKTRDDEWIVDMVSASFVGNALRWYIALDEAIQNNWKKLQQAMLVEYPSPQQQDRTSNYVIPITAAATPPSTAPSTDSSLRKGHIRVEATDSSVSGFVTRTRSDGWLASTQNAAEALQVGYSSSTESFEMEMLGPSLSLHPLGIRWSTSNPLVGSTWAYLVGVSKACTNDVFSSWDGEGEIVPAIWRIDKERMLALEWTDKNGDRHLLTPTINVSTKKMFAAFESSNLFRSSTYTQVVGPVLDHFVRSISDPASLQRLFFEPV